MQREPEGVEVGPGEEGLEAAAQLLAQRLLDCAQTGAAALVGGHTGAWFRAILLLGERLPDLYYFDTRRRTDERGRFVFAPERLARIARERPP